MSGGHGAARRIDAFFDVGAESGLIGVQVVVENDFFQAVVIEIVLWLRVMASFFAAGSIARGSTGAATPTARIA